MCSGESYVSCKCGGLSWQEWPYGVWCGGPLIYSPISAPVKIRYFWPDISRVSFTQRSIHKDSDTSNTAALTLTLRSLDFFVVENLFLHTNVVNDDTSVVLSPCVSPSRNSPLTPACVRNVLHVSQLPDFLAAVALDITLVMSRMMLVTISRRYYLCTAALCGMTHLYVVGQYS